MSMSMYTCEFTLYNSCTVHAHLSCIASKKIMAGFNLEVAKADRQIKFPTKFSSSTVIFIINVLQFTFFVSRFLSMLYVQVMDLLVLPSLSCSLATGPTLLGTTLTPTSLASSNRHLRLHYCTRFVNLSYFAMKFIGWMIFFLIY